MESGSPKRTTADRLKRVEESATMQVTVSVLKMKGAGIDVIDLGAGEPDFFTPDAIKDAAKRAIDANFTRYTAATGTPELKRAVVTRYKEDFDVDLSPDEIVITAGGKQSIFNVLLALLDPGDEVIIPSPYWVTYPQAVRLCGGTPVIAEVSSEDGFRVSAELIQRHITSRTRILIINSPHNPTGAVIPQPEFLKICRLSAELGITVLCDECYQRILYDHFQPYSGAAMPADLRPWVIVAGSLSKTYAMTGWRIGYTISPRDLAAKIGIIQGHQTSHPSSISQAAAVEALTGPQEVVDWMVERYQERRDFVVDALNRIEGIRCFRPQGAFYVFPDIRALMKNQIGSSADFAARLLEEAHVAVTPGLGFGMDGFIRISYAAALGSLEDAMYRIATFCSRL